MLYDKLPVVFLTMIASEKSGSTNQQIALYILDHLHEVKHIGIQEMAERCHVAPSSISRFCKEIGLTGFTELKELLVEANLQFQNTIFAESSKQRLSNYGTHVRNCIAAVEQSIDMSAVQRLCQDIATYQQITVFGLLKASGVALNLQCDLLMLGKRVNTHIAYQEQLDHLLQAKQNELIIIFSYTGSYFDYPTTRHIQAHLRAPKIWLISSYQDHAPDFVDDTIGFVSLQDQNSHPYQLQFVAGLIAQEYAKLTMDQHFHSTRNPK